MKNDDLDRFERWLENTRMNAPHHFRMAMIDVADTAYGCKLWFESQGFNASAADVMTMTRLVIEREAARQREEVRDLSDPEISN